MLGVQRHIQIGRNLGLPQTYVSRQTVLRVVYQTLVTSQTYTPDSAATHGLAEAHRVNNHATVSYCTVVNDVVFTGEGIEFNFHETNGKRRYQTRVTAIFGHTDQTSACQVLYRTRSDLVQTFRSAVTAVFTTQVDCTLCSFGVGQALGRVADLEYTFAVDVVIICGTAQISSSNFLQLADRIVGSCHVGTHLGEHGVTTSLEGAPRQVQIGVTTYNHAV